MEGSFSAEDEMFLFETFTKITNKESQNVDCLFFDDDNDTPLSEFFLFEKDIQQWQSENPTNIIPEYSQQHFFPDSFFSDQSQTSPPDSPTSLFPPVHVDNLFTPCTPPPSLSPTSPTVTPFPILSQKSPTATPPVSLSPTPPTVSSPPSLSPTSVTLSPTSASPPSPDYPAQSLYTPPPLDADLVTVDFIDLKDLYEKTQVRRGGVSEQRLVDCRVHMLAQFTKAICSIVVYVCRYPETGVCEDKIQFPVTLERTLHNTQYFSVNLDSVYQTTLGNPFYHLSTTHRFKKNRFIIDVTLKFTDESRANVKSEPFLVRSRRQSPNPRKKRMNSH